MYELVVKGGTYVGCNQGNCYPQTFIPGLLQARQQGQFPYDDLIKTYAPQDLETAAKDIHEGTTVKAVLLWD